MTDNIIDICESIIAKANSKTTNLSSDGIQIKKYDITDSNIIDPKLKVTGGLNGNGNWEDYFETLRKVVKIAKEDYNVKMWLIELRNDCDDDIFYATFGLQMLDQ